MDATWAVGKAVSWIQTIKDLPYDGGPSTARWVYLRVAEAMTACIVALVVCVCIVYCRTGKCDPNVGILIAAMVTALFGFAANTKNNAAQLEAQKDNPKMGDTKSTPLSSEVAGEKH